MSEGKEDGGHLRGLGALFFVKVRLSSIKGEKERRQS